MTEATAEPKALRVSFDDADIDLVALQAARRKAFMVLVKQGVTDLNATTADSWDLFAMVLVLAYHNKLAERNHGFSHICWGVSLNGTEVEIPG